MGGRPVCGPINMLTEKVGTFRKEFGKYGKFPSIFAHDGFDKGCDALQYFERIFSFWPVFEMCEGEHKSIRHGECDAVIVGPSMQGLVL